MPNISIGAADRHSSKETYCSWMASSAKEPWQIGRVVTIPPLNGLEFRDFPPSCLTQLGCYVVGPGVHISKQYLGCPVAGLRLQFADGQTAGSHPR